MYSWNTIRNTFAVLLLLPILHLILLVSQEMAANLDHSPTAWEGEVNAYTEAYLARSLPGAPIIVIGGRGVKLWKGLEDILSPRPVLMLGLGDATVDDIAHYHSQLIGHYRPSAVVLLPGNSEFHVRDNKSATELVDAIRELIELDHSYQAARQFIVFVPVKNPLYPQDYTTIDKVAQLLARWAVTQPQVSVINANPLLAQKGGSPNPDFFRLGGSNLNEHGYLRVSLLLQGQLSEQEGELQALGGEL